MSMPIIWLVVTIVFLIGEGATFGLVSIWFAGGSAVALAASLAGAPLWVQLILFALCSGICLHLTRDWAQKYVNDRHQRTNADRIVGTEGVVVETIDNTCAAGLVRVSGQLWTARAIRENTIEENTPVIITAIEGVKVMVIRKPPVSPPPKPTRTGELVEPLNSFAPNPPETLDTAPECQEPKPPQETQPTEEMNTGIFPGEN